MFSADRLFLLIISSLAIAVYIISILTAPAAEPAPAQTRETVVYIVPENKPLPIANRSLRYEALEVTVTAYSPEDPGVDDTTYTGLPVDIGVVAVDPSVIPLGSVVYVPGYGYAVALDRGGAIKGHRVDVYFPTREAATAWGVKKLKIRVFGTD